LRAVNNPARRRGRAGRFLLAAALGTAGAHLTFAADNLLNRKAPEFAVSDFSGQTLRLASFHGKVVLLNFWATWCAPCQVEMPVFGNWRERYASQGFEVIGISMDDDATDAHRLVRTLKLNYPTAMGDERLGALYGRVMGLPLTFLIDRNGVIRARFQGETDLNSIERRVRELLAQPQAQP